MDTLQKKQIIPMSSNIFWIKIQNLADFPTINASKSIAKIPKWKF